jgi:glyoxylase-like metal-dependent hydrolase (beta-lactamase superfamily II)
MCGSPFVPVTDYTAVLGDSWLNDGDCEFRVLHTPGHTEGSVCYICGDVIFSGDTLFCESVGRTDFPGSSTIDMKRSLRLLKNLDGNYKVLPGHNESTELDWERQYNPFMSIV